MRILGLVLVLAALLGAPARAGEAADAPGSEAPVGWTVARQTLDGDERRPWYLALVFHKTPKVVTLVLAPAASAGNEGRGIDVERIERSAIGDRHQIARWAERLRMEAEGWRRPSLRDRPPASAHVIGMVGVVRGEARVENAEHGGRMLGVGDFLFVEDVISTAPGAVVGVELVGAENLWHYRTSVAELRLGEHAKVGLRGTRDALRIHVHRGAVEGRTRERPISLRTASVEYAVGPDATFLLVAGDEDQLALREGTVQVSHAGAVSTLVGGSSLAVETSGAQRVLPLDEAAWRKAMPPAEACPRDEALRMVDRLQGTWRGQQLNAQLTLSDDGQWTSYERQPGRSITKGGSWEPLPGGLVQLTYVWTPHRSSTPTTEVYRYVLDGKVLRRLVPGGPVYLKD